MLVWQARQEMCEAAAAAEEAGHRGMSSQHHSGSGLAAVREKARAVLDALRTLAKLALRTSAAMQAATASLQTASHVSPAQVLLPSFNPNDQYLVQHTLHRPFECAPSLLPCVVVNSQC